MRLIKGAGLKRVLLLAGDTQTKLCYEQDKNVVFILGDGGTATLLEADPSAGDIVIEVMTDGGRFQNLYVPAGGFRQPSTEATRQVREQADGGMRSEDHLYMNGMEIFKFSVTDVVKTLAGFMEAEKLSADGMDHLFLHQANGFMNDKIAKKLKFPAEKVPYTIEFYGNTGSASIPLTMAHHFSQKGSARPAAVPGFRLRRRSVLGCREHGARGRLRAPGGGARLVASTCAFLFPGQGSQYVGMGKSLFDAMPPCSGFSMRRPTSSARTSPSCASKDPKRSSHGPTTCSRRSPW